MSHKVKPNKLKPRWSKVISDLWGDKARTALVVSSIAAGVFAIGMIISSFVIMQREINANYAAANPPNIEIWTDPFYSDFVRLVKKIPGVAQAEGRRIMTVRVKKGDENWQNVSLVAIQDLESSLINQLSLLEGDQFPGRDEVVFSEDMMNSTGFQVGDQIEIELPNGSTHPLVVIGLVSDQTTTKPDPESSSNAFVTLNTLKSFGLDDYFNRLYVNVDGDGGEDEFISLVAAAVENRVEKNHREVYRMEEMLSNEHPMSDSIAAMMGVLGALGVLVTFLSASLIINTLNAMMTQQLRQIGVMKLVGGRSLQILGMYLTLILSYSLIALIIAVPLGSLAGYGLAKFMADMMGAVVQDFRIIPAAVAAQVLIAFLIPLAAGFFPVNKGAKTKVRRAISDYRPNVQSSRHSLFNQGVRWLRPISRPILLSFRNTFRKKGRLILTVFTLTVGGAVFIAVFNVRFSMDSVMDQLTSLFLGDVTIDFTQPYKVSKVERDLLVVPGVTGVEGWGGASGDILDPSDEVVTGLSIIAPPQDTRLLTLDYLAGRWLNPSEDKAIVVSDTIYNYYPNLIPGDTLTVEVTGNREEEWTVVGVFRYVDMFGDPLAYADFDFIADVIDLPNQARSYRITTGELDSAMLLNLIRGIDQQLDDQGYAVQSVTAGNILRESAGIAVNTLVLFLLIMAILTAFVGSIGLTGTMSISVLERTREIGVMRTIGAVDFVVMQSVIIEALVIGMITWFLAIGLSFPLSSALLNIISKAMAGSSFPLKTTPLGLLIWLGVVVLLSIIASIIPARNAARLTINEVLAYE